MKIYLNEDTSLYRGIFWIPDIDDVESSEFYFQIPCDSNGNINDPDFVISNLQSSKGNNNYNHEKVWNSLDKKYTKGKPFNYYPRGRIEISNGKATIYASPHIPQDDLKSWVIDKFNLTTYNGIKKIRIVADGSEHYKCFLDE